MKQRITKSHVLPAYTFSRWAVMPSAFSLLVMVFMTTNCEGGLIDDFTTAQSNPTTGLRGAVTGTGILGTERDVILDDDKGTVVIQNGGATYRSLESSGLTMEWDGVQGGDGSPDRARELPLTDFTQGGLNDRFVVDITTMTGVWSVGIFVTSGTTPFTSHTLLNLDSPGELEIPFSYFDRDYLEEANGISLRFNPKSNGQSITIHSFQAVPEPSSLILFTAAGFALAFFRRNSRRRR